MNFKQCGESIYKLITDTEAADDLALLRLYATCLTLIEEAKRLCKDNHEPENYGGEHQYNIDCLNASVEHIRMAIFEDGNRTSHIESASFEASKTR